MMDPYEEDSVPTVRYIKAAPPTPIIDLGEEEDMCDGSNESLEVG